MNTSAPDITLASFFDNWELFRTSTLADTVADLYERGVVWPKGGRKSLASGGQSRAGSLE